MSTPIPRPTSNPIANSLENRPLPMAEAPLWLLENYPEAPLSTPVRPNKKGYIQTVCGNCQSMPSAFDLLFNWSSNNQTKVTLPGTVPNLRDDWCYIFDSIRLERRALIQPGILSPHSQWLIHATAPLTNANCNWAGQLLGPTRKVVLPSTPAGTPPAVLSNAIPNLQWFLFYSNDGNSINGTVPFVPSDFDTSLLVPDPLNFDSLVSGSGTIVNPNTFSADGWPDPPTITGWCLALVKRQIIKLDPFDPFSPETVVFAGFALYQLLSPPPLSDGTTLTPVFKCQDRNTWQLAFNPLDFPQHTIVTVPSA